MRSMKYKSIILTHPFVSYAPSFLSENESEIEAAFEIEGAVTSKQP